MRNVLCIVVIVVGVLLAGNKAEAVQQLPGMSDPACKEAKPVADLVRVPVVRSCDKDNNGANDCAGKNPYQCSLHCMGLEGVDLDFSMRMTVAQGDGTCGRLNLGGTLVWKGAVGPGNDRPGDAYVDPRKPLPSGMLLFGAYQDREILVATHVDYCDQSLGDLARCKSERDQLAVKVAELEKGQQNTAVVVAVPFAPQSKTSPAGSVEAAADRETMAVAVVQAKLAWVTLGLIALVIVVVALVALWLRARRELRRCHGWLEQIRTTANVGAETHYRDFAAVICRLMGDSTTTLRKLRSEKDAVFAKLRRDILDALAIGELRPDQNLADVVLAMREKGGVAVSAMSEIAEELHVGLDSKGDTKMYEGQARVVVAGVTALKKVSANHGDGKCVSQAVHDAAVAGHGADECVPVARHNAMLVRAAEDLAIEVGKVGDLREQLAGAREELTRAREQLEQRVLHSEFEALQEQVTTMGAEVGRLTRLEGAMREMAGLASGMEAICNLLRPPPGHRGYITIELSRMRAKGHRRTLLAWREVMDRNPMPAPAGN